MIKALKYVSLPTFSKNHQGFKNGVFAFLSLSGLFPFLFEQIPPSSYNFRPDLAEA